MRRYHIQLALNPDNPDDAKLIEIAQPWIDEWGMATFMREAIRHLGEAGPPPKQNDTRDQLAFILNQVREPGDKLDAVLDAVNGIRTMLLDIAATGSVTVQQVEAAFDTGGLDEGFLQAQEKRFHQKNRG